MNPPPLAPSRLNGLGSISQTRAGADQRKMPS